MNRSVPHLMNMLANATVRTAVAAELARCWGADDLLILILDPELQIYYPAPGFRQTLPGGAQWRELLRRCKHEEEFRIEVAYPDLMGTSVAHVLQSNGAAIVFLGNQVHVSWSDLEGAGFPVLFSLLKAERVAAIAASKAAAADEASQRAVGLASSLDRARGEIQTRAGQLQEALRESARLNAELKALNDTLEHRVAERSRKLEEEVAERRKIEAELSQAQKMEAVGQLTGGIAHDFNNLLTVIIGGLDRIDRQLSDLPVSSAVSRIERATKMAMEGATRAATLTHRLLAFSRRQPLDPKPLNVNKLVMGMSEMLQRTLGETITVETILDAGLWHTFADANQLESALLNLTVNARDAMPNGGRLTIETANTYIDEAYARHAADAVTPGQYVMLAITDTGVGMDSETVAHVFEPFFTTKETGKGTGLGLSQVYGFVRQSHGHVKVYSEMGEGTAVKVYLPRHDVSETEVRKQEKATDVLVDGNGATILVVEDNPTLRTYSVETVSELGYHVLEAGDGPTALKILSQDRQIDLLFTDVVLPEGMNGRQLADEAQRLRPGLKVLFTTGYTQTAIIQNGRLDPGVHLIGKPFTYGDLSEKIRKVLGSG